MEGGNYELQNRVKDLTYKKVSSELRTRRTLRTLKDGYMSSVESRYIQLQTRVREGQYNASGVAVVHNMGPSGPCCRRRCQRYRAIRPAAGSGGGGGSSSAEAAGVPPPPRFLWSLSAPPCIQHAAARGLRPPLCCKAVSGGAIADLKKDKEEGGRKKENKREISEAHSLPQALEPVGVVLSRPAFQC